MSDDELKSDKNVEETKAGKKKQPNTTQASGDKKPQSDHEFDEELRKYLAIFRTQNRKIQGSRAGLRAIKFHMALMRAADKVDHAKWQQTLRKILKKESSEYIFVYRLIATATEMVSQEQASTATAGGDRDSPGPSGNSGRPKPPSPDNEDGEGKEKGEGEEQSEEKSEEQSEEIGMQSCK
ncbi:hypothetical protein P280DRAFT_483118 [Massarina eburnea CBS 473.64]|uniref:Uncharacterized protein n=1 Tax=Massarina eburnea CBS 473.64 TaxID=1395130 RepID=A0A6A6RPH0_9PLEO|nr:hypothetical protein P280DRAFT_483118 [Massarina eburnea CBS 473.64]